MSPETDRVVVVVDVDDDDCEDLLARLKKLRAHVGVAPLFITRLAIEEMEAWYLGDPAAMRRAFGTVRPSILSKYEQDSICGTWEMLMKVIAARVEDKVAWAARIGPELNVGEPLEKQNGSPSFRKFCRRVRELAGDTTPRVGRVLEPKDRKAGTRRRVVRGEKRSRTRS